MNTTENLAPLLRAMGRAEEGLECLREALDIRRRVFGDDHPSTLAAALTMGQYLTEPGERESQVRAALAGTRRVFGDDHPETLRALGFLGSALRAAGKFRFE